MSKSRKNIFNLLSKIETDMTKEPWKGILWETHANRMITRKENKDVAIYLCYYMIGFDLKKVRQSTFKLKEEYASLLNKNIDEIDLPKKVV